jgi:undecaprenyl-diphosphatase
VFVVLRRRLAGRRPNLESGATFEPLQATVATSVAPRWLARLRTRVASTVVALGIAVFAGQSWLVSAGATAGPDLAITVGLQSLGSPLLAGLMVLVSGPGFAPLNVGLVSAASGLFWLSGLRREALYAAGAALGISALGLLLKSHWLRPRPEDGLVQVIGSTSGYSFPSGHTLFYVGFFGFLFYWCYASLRKGRLRTALLWLFGLLMLLVGPSRIYLGHHWASDVLASYALGLAYLLLVIRAYGSARFSRRGSLAARL